MTPTATTATGQKFLKPLGTHLGSISKLFIVFDTDTVLSKQMSWVNFSKATHQNSVSKLLLQK